MKKELVSLGYGNYQSEDIIRRSKALMVEKVFSYYLNKRLGLVPVQTVEEILGMKLDSVGKETSLVG
ncbi:DUF3173 family protein [Enterococcus thailandicus]|uniref:DUF3173 family protein n=1 Tax=Enterococcus thailandicus TaxID=417368 RepID=UPI0025530ED1|nr:DUF3173 family protein [Enterococcus thailandicus]